MRTYVYPELRQGLGRRDGSGNLRPAEPKPAFPPQCPCCGAIARGDQDQSDFTCDYACGGRYALKPQIQNHTNYWWGYCPTLKQEAESTVTVTVDRTGEVMVRDGTGKQVCSGCRQRPGDMGESILEHLRPAIARADAAMQADEDSYYARGGTNWAGD